MLADMPLRQEDGKSNAYYLEVPVHFGYKHTVSDKFALFGEFGPYFACGLFGKTSSNALDYDDNFDFVSESEKPDTFDEFKRFDFGLLYFDMCIIKYFLDIISPNNDMLDKMNRLFATFPEVDKAALGFPSGWENEPLWQ